MKPRPRPALAPVALPLIFLVLASLQASAAECSSRVLGAVEPPQWGLGGFEAWLLAGRGAVPLLAVPLPEDSMVDYYLAVEKRGDGLAAVEYAVAVPCIGGRYVLLAPCEARPTAQPPSAAAVYRSPLGAVVVAPGVPIRVPLLEAGQRVAVTVIGEDGERLAAYRFDLDDLAGVPILEPNVGEETAGLLEPPAAGVEPRRRGGLLLDSLPWSGAWGSVSGLGLGPLIGKGGVEARLGGVYRASDTFLVPPHSLRVEVWVVIRPRGPGLFRATLLFDGAPVASASSDGRTLVMGVIVLPQGSRYLAERFHRVALRLETVRGTSTVVYHVHAWSLSETEPRGPGVYRFYSEAAGAPAPRGPTPRGALPIPRWGALTLHLPLPSNAFLGSGSLELEVRGMGLPRLVKVYVAGLEVCSGPSYPGPGGLQVFHCRVPAYLLEYTLWGYMVVGRALPVRVELSGGLVEPYTWWLQGLRLEVTSRARLYVKAWAKSQVPYMVSSYPSEKMWSMAFNSPGSVTVYSYSLGHRAGATIAGAAGLVAGERPLAGMEGQDKHVYIYIPVGGTVAPYYEPGLAQAYVHGVDLWITLKYTGQREGLGTVRVLEARRLGRGGLSEEATRALGVASWMTGAASILLEAVNPLAARMAGVASLLLGYPSTFQQGVEAWHREYYVYKTIMLHGEPVNVVLEMRSHVRAAAWLGPGGTAGGVYVDIGLAPYTLLWGRDSWRVEVEGTVTLIVSHPGSQQAYMLRLPLRGEAVFTWR